jgi:mono/diheme cytochrome c family protein
MLEKLYHHKLIGRLGRPTRGGAIPMTVRFRFGAVLLAAFVAACAAAQLLARPGAEAAPQAQTSGWQLPADARDLKNPLTVDDKVLAAGKKVFSDKCQKCHGAKGLGDGADADPDYAEEMNLTNPKRADRNPDGVVFYKVTNGRRKPKMPAFKDELSPNQIWSVVAYVQTLRK